MNDLVFRQLIKFLVDSQSLHAIRTDLTNRSHFHHRVSSKYPPVSGHACRPLAVYIILSIKD